MTRGPVTASILLSLFVVPVQPVLHAQTPKKGGPVFEVASIKPGPPLETSSQPGGFQPGGGRFLVRNTTLRMILRRAYPEFSSYAEQIDGPEWLETARFDIDARAGYDAPVSEIRLMLRALLTDRFGMRVHIEKRQLPMYLLEPARSDRSLGPNIRTSRRDCAAIEAQQQRSSAMPVIEPPPPGQWPECGLAQSYVNGIRGLYIGGRSVESLSALLGGLVDRPLVNNSGMKGEFDIKLEWWAADDPALATDRAPGIQTALLEQLGLKLRPTTGPADVLVIDEIHRPTPN